MQIHRIELSNEALVYLSQQLKEALLSGQLDKARAVVRGVIKRVDLFKEKVIAQYIVPLSDSGDQLKVGFSVCPHGNSNPGLGLERATS